MKYLNIIILLLLTTSFYSCNDYLDEIPEKSSGIVISKVEELPDFVTTKTAIL